MLVRLFAAPALATRALDGGEGASYGVAWLFPAAGGLAGLVVVILVWLRVPRAAAP